MPSEQFLDINGLRTHALTWDGGGDTTVLRWYGSHDDAVSHAAPPCPSCRR